MGSEVGVVLSGTSRCVNWGVGWSYEKWKVQLAVGLEHGRLQWGMGVICVGFSGSIADIYDRVGSSSRGGIWILVCVLEVYGV